MRCLCKEADDTTTKAVQRRLKSEDRVRGDQGAAHHPGVASHYEVHPTQVRQWKKQLLMRAAEIFSGGKTGEAKVEEELKAELYQQIGKLQVEGGSRLA
jgi:transposase-like protein